jgi:hypothetical protein
VTSFKERAVLSKLYPWKLCLNNNETVPVIRGNGYFLIFYGEDDVNVCTTKVSNNFVNQIVL